MGPHVECARQSSGRTEGIAGGEEARATTGTGERFGRRALNAWLIPYTAVQSCR